MNLYVLTYNNYYNRVVKSEPDLASYSGYVIHTLLGANFNPNDGVNTEYVFGTAAVNYSGTGDYLIAVDEYNEIVSRWFIIENVFNRKGQWQVLLRRDLVVDFYRDILRAPAFIERAMLPDTDNFIFQPEGMTYNQILQSERILKDETNSAWIVGYVPRDAFAEDTPVSVSVPGTATSADITVSSLSQWNYNQYRISNFKAYPETVGLKVNATITTTDETDVSGSYPKYKTTTTLDDNMNIVSSTAGTQTGINIGGASIVLFGGNSDPVYQLARKFAEPYSRFAPAIKGLIANYVNAQTEADTSNFASLQGKTILESDTGFVYAINVVEKETQVATDTAVVYGSALGYGLYETYADSVVFNNGVVDRTFTKGETFDNTTFYISATCKTYQIELTQQLASYSTTLNSTRYHAMDIPYDIFCIPYNAINIYKNGTLQFKANPEVATAIANAIGTNSGSGSIYDIQLLPYLPCRYAIDANNRLDIKNSLVHYIKDGENNNVSVILWATSSSFQFKITNLPYSVSTDPIQLKVQNETEFIRLCSPNYNGVFEMTPAKNGGLTEVSINCTYKPFNPFIQVIPKFGRLYGINVGGRKDSRGLICGGDYSIAQTTDAWANYEQQNKNYLSIFDRGIENMETTRRAQRIGEIFGGAAGVIGGGVSGATTGTIVGGGPVGAVVGGAVGTITSAAGMAGDIVMNEKLYNEALDYKRDVFEYQMGNIKALPQGLAKTSALSINNKIWPFIQYYKCSSAESEALSRKIQYSGMTVGRIGTISEFIGNEPQFLKARLIRLEGLEDDYHMLKEIAAEIYKGVFI